MPNTRPRNVPSHLMRANLPRSYNVHWSDARKAEVVRAVSSKAISFDEARRKYLLSRSEFESWQDEFGDKNVTTRELELH